MFSERLKSLRKIKNISQKQMASDLEISERNYQYYKYGEIMPSAKNLITIADYFEVSIDYLVGRTDNPEINK